MPLAGLLLIVVAIANLPGSDCDGVENPTSGAEVVLIVLTAAVSLCCAVAAAARVVALTRGGRIVPRQLALLAIASALLVLLVAASVDEQAWPDLLGWLGVYGSAATALALLALLAAWLGRRSPDQVGLLLPAYLVGAGVFVYPLFAWIALVFNSGALC